MGLSKIVRRQLKPFLAALFLTSFVFAAPAAADKSEASEYGVVHTNEAGELVVVFGPTGLLDEATTVWIAGEKLPDGGCRFPIPTPPEDPGDEGAAAHQVATNFTRCETLVEFGIPTPASEPKDPPADEIASEGVALGEHTAAFGLEGRSGGGALAGGADQAKKYKVWWEDAWNIRVTRTTVDIVWGYDGEVVEYSSGYAKYEWRSGTGWRKHSSGFYTNQTSQRHKYWTNVTYKNSVFCWPGTVWNYYVPQNLEGWYNGTYGYWVSTYTTYPFACPQLHWHWSVT